MDLEKRIDALTDSLIYYGDKLSKNFAIVPYTLLYVYVSCSWLKRPT